MPMPQFVLLADAIKYIDEEENQRLLALYNYKDLSKKAKQDLESKLFPISATKRNYWDYNDNGEGIRLLKQISRR